MANKTQGVFRFAEFRLDAAEKRLLRGAEPVALPPKVFDLLLLLVSNPGKLLDKEYLLATLWPGTFVEESNLSVNVSALRRALGEGAGQSRFIETVPKRGYRFVAGVSLEELPADSPAPSPTAPPIAASPPRAAMSKTTVRVCVVALSLGLAALAGWGVRRFAAAPRSIAVLPFVPLDGGEAQKYLGLGMADAIITRLTALGKIDVRPTSAVMKYAGAIPDTAEAGRDLQVDALLHGRVQHQANQVRITVQLVRVRDGKQLWAETFDDGFANIFALQDAIAERTARALELPMTESDHRNMTRRGTDNTEAYRWFIQGQYLASKRLHEATLGAIDHFERAIALDGNYAQPYAALASSYLIRAGEGFSGDLREKAKSAALRAIALDANLAEAHLALGQTLMRAEWDWAAAERSFRRALELNAQLAPVHASLSTLATALGRHEEAVRSMERAVALDPASASLRSDLAWTNLFARRTGAALEHARKAVDLDPWSYSAHRQLSKALTIGGSHNEAIAEARKALDINGGRRRRVIAELAKAFAAAGRKQEAEAILLDVEREGWTEPEPHYELAVAYAALGDHTRAVELLEKAVAERLSRTIWMAFDPELDALRAEPRFRKLIERMRLPSRA
jgi:DNA-binding winged helix-turn-helix (wHTH) protein/TolB-like protein/tetratricopeptide (TPR) repeat protein